MKWTGSFSLGFASRLNKQKQEKCFGVKEELELTQISLVRFITGVHWWKERPSFAKNSIVVHISVGQQTPTHKQPESLPCSAKCSDGIGKSTFLASLQRQHNWDCTNRITNVSLTLVENYTGEEKTKLDKWLQDAIEWHTVWVACFSVSAQREKS